MSKHKSSIIAVLAVFGMILITAGVTYAFFTYTKVGTTVNTITADSITFHYDEKTNKGHGISITDAMPVEHNSSAMEDSNNIFDFKITSSTTQGLSVPYTVTAKLNSGSDEVMGDIVDMYLTEVTNKGEVNEDEDATALFDTYKKFNTLQPYSEAKAGTVEKVILTDTVTSSNSPYDKDYRLRMWVDEQANYAEMVCSNTTYTTEADCKEHSGTWNYKYNNKTFSITVNVYATGETIEIPTPTPTIASCPGCRYLYTTTKLYPSTNGYERDASILALTDTKEDYNDVIEESGKQYFLGVILSDGDHGTVERAFACGIKGEEPNQGVPFCIEATSDSSLKETVYANNKTLLSDETTGIYGPYDSETSLGCREDSTMLYCGGTVYVNAYRVGGSYVYAGGGGDVIVGVGGNYCGVNSLGLIKCQ